LVPRGAKWNGIEAPGVQNKELRLQIRAGFQAFIAWPNTPEQEQAIMDNLKHYGNKVRTTFTASKQQPACKR
jgi:hypothetical protein